MADIPLVSGLSFRPELNFIQKGGEFTFSNTANANHYSISTDKSVMNYVELPLNVVYSMQAGPGKFSVGVGPNVSFGVSGSQKWNYETGGTGLPTRTTSGIRKIKFDGKNTADLPPGDGDVHDKRVDFGENSIIGYALNMGVFLTAGYTIGLSTINPNPDYTIKTGGFALKIGYMIRYNAANKAK